MCLVKKYHNGLGPIDGVTWAKSVSTLKSYQHTKGSSRAASSSTPQRAEREGSSSSGGVITVESLHHEMHAIKKGFKRLE